MPRLYLRVLAQADKADFHGLKPRNGSGKIFLAK
jgi:hypothetical protein